MLGEKDMENDNGELPMWALRAESLDHKPGWVEDIKVPEALRRFGRVFFPIPPYTKGYNWPHHDEDHRFAWDDEMFHAFMESGWSYGISCANGLAVVDIDELDYLDEIVNLLPETAYQVSGSREGYHLFYKVENLDTRMNLYVWKCTNCESEFTEWIPIGDEDDDNTEYMCPECSERKHKVKSKRHLGEVKCDPHGYVVGPGSTHPSGNKYGPLKGDTVTEMEKERIEEILEPYTIDESDKKKKYAAQAQNYEDVEQDLHDLFKLSASDVMPYLEPDNRVAHPVHGSDTNANFMMNDSRQTFVCWRCQYGGGEGCVLSGTHFLAASGLDSVGKAGKYVCQRVRNDWTEDYRLYFHAWRKAVENGILEPTNPPYSVVGGYAEYMEFVSDQSEFGGTTYHKALTALRYDMIHGFAFTDSKQ